MRLHGLGMRLPTWLVGGVWELGTDDRLASKIAAGFEVVDTHFQMSLQQYSVLLMYVYSHMGPLCPSKAST